MLTRRKRKLLEQQPKKHSLSQRTTRINLSRRGTHSDEADKAVEETTADYLYSLCDQFCQAVHSRKSTMPTTQVTRQVSIRIELSANRAKEIATILDEGAFDRQYTRRRAYFCAMNQQKGPTAVNFPAFNSGFNSYFKFEKEYTADGTERKTCSVCQKLTDHVRIVPHSTTNENACSFNAHIEFCNFSDLIVVPSTQTACIRELERRLFIHSNFQFLCNETRFETGWTMFPVADKEMSLSLVQTENQTFHLICSSIISSKAVPVTQADVHTQCMKVRSLLQSFFIPKIHIIQSN